MGQLSKFKMFYHPIQKIWIYNDILLEELRSSDQKVDVTMGGLCTYKQKSKMIGQMTDFNYCIRIIKDELKKERIENPSHLFASSILSLKWEDDGHTTFGDVYKDAVEIADRLDKPVRFMHNKIKYFVEQDGTTHITYDKFRTVVLSRG